MRKIRFVVLGSVIALLLALTPFAQADTPEGRKRTERRHLRYL